LSAPRRILAGWAAAALGALLAAALAPVVAAEGGDAGPRPALTNEDVVRMVASGIPESEILQTIDARPEAFDLAEDMVQELKLAGVPASVLAAMRHRHAEGARPSAPPDRIARGHVRLTVTLNAGPKEPRTLRAPAWADEDAKARLKLPKENEQREVKDLAVFLACTTGDHVPDLWRSKSPLGRDMVNASRHEMLAFVAGDTPAGKTPRLVLPDRIEADVDDAEPHDVVIGVAARIGDHWVQLGIGRLAHVEVVAGAKPLAGRITRGSESLEFKVELIAPPRPGR